MTTGNNIASRFSLVGFFFLFLLNSNSLLAVGVKDNPLFFNEKVKERFAEFDLCGPSDNILCKKLVKGAPTTFSFFITHNGSLWPDGLLGTIATFDDEAKVSRFSWSLENDQINIIFTEAGRLSGHQNGGKLFGKIISDRVIQIDGAFYQWAHD